MADIGGIHDALIGTLFKIAQDGNEYRDQEMANMIDMLCEVHSVAIVTLASAVLMSAKDKAAKGESNDDLLNIVRELIENTDSQFSLRLRSKLLAFISEHKVPNPFEVSRPEKPPEVMQ